MRNAIAMALVLALAACGDDDPCDVAAPSCKAEWPNWPIPTGPGKFRVGKKTVIDEITGLEWQRKPPKAGYHWQRAKEYCAELSLDGHDDWRLPRRLELISLVDYSRANPVLDTEAFPDTDANEYWTASHAGKDENVPGADVADDAWTVSFENGQIHKQPKDLIFPRARCVRGGKKKRPSKRFVEKTDTIRDAGSGLTWKLGYGPMVGYESARQHCAGLGTGWRLPHVKELLTLMYAVEKKGAYIDQQYYSSGNSWHPGRDAWTTTMGNERVEGRERTGLWSVDFEYGSMHIIGSNSENTATICVNGSDTGDPVVPVEPEQPAPMGSCAPEPHICFQPVTGDAEAFRDVCGFWDPSSCAERFAEQTFATCTEASLFASSFEFGGTYYYLVPGSCSAPITTEYAIACDAVGGNYSCLHE